jgi:hypothetical protein
MKHNINCISATIRECDDAKKSGRQDRRFGRKEVVLQE